MELTGLIFNLLFLTIIRVIFCQERDTFTMQVFIKNPRPIEAESHSFVIQPFPEDKIYYIVKFIPNVTMEVVHHMIVSSCQSVSHRFNGELTCVNSAIMYAWAKNATALELPDDVGFKVGRGTERQFVHIDIHFTTPQGEIDDNTANHIGVNLVLTDKPKSKTAHTMRLLNYEGSISPGKRAIFDISCTVPNGVAMHVFAFRPHAHKLGKVISGYVVKQCSTGKCQWNLIGKKDPQNPQMFYPVVNKSLIASPGDILAVRCAMQNDQNHSVSIGATSSDEMCTLYVMYWKTNTSTEFMNNCFKPGPKMYGWANDKNLNNIPKDASVL